MFLTLFKVRSVFLKNGSTDFCRHVGQMHLISARAERAYSRSILKRLKMSQTRSSANTFQIRTKNISSDNTHLRFSSRRAHHEIEEETCRYTIITRRVFTFASAQKRNKLVFARDTSDKNFQKRVRFSAQKWSNNTTTDDDDDGGGASTSKIESILRTTTTTAALFVETYCENNGRIEIWCARSRTRKRFRKSSLESS